MFSVDAVDLIKLRRLDQDIKLVEKLMVKCWEDAVDMDLLEIQCALKPDYLHLSTYDTSIHSGAPRK